MGKGLYIVTLKDLRKTAQQAGDTEVVSMVNEKLREME